MPAVLSVTCYYLCYKGSVLCAAAGWKEKTISWVFGTFSLNEQDDAGSVFFIEVLRLVTLYMQMFLYLWAVLCKLTQYQDPDLSYQHLNTRVPIKMLWLCLFAFCGLSVYFLHVDVRRRDVLFSMSWQKLHLYEAEEATCLSPAAACVCFLKACFLLIAQLQDRWVSFPHLLSPHLRPSPLRCKQRRRGRDRRREESRQQVGDRVVVALKPSF